MQRDRAYLLDILDSARLVLVYIDGITRDEFAKNVYAQDAVIRRLEIIGEAARRLSDETRQEIVTLPWSDMIGMRNFLIHQYDHVDLDVVWDTLVDAIPVVVEELEHLLAETSENPEDQNS